FTFRTETRVEGLSPDPDVTIRVTAFRWSWRFDYQGEGVSVFGTPDDPPEMVVPVGRTVRIVLTSTDVIHSFFLRDFAFKRDAIPGRVTRFDLTVERAGLYPSQVCGDLRPRPLPATVHRPGRVSLRLRGVALGHPHGPGRGSTRDRDCLRADLPRARSLPPDGE
ncbi:MAG: hypothetical protein ACRDH1_11015, partial [Actinomycetota bacterium]